MPIQNYPTVFDCTEMTDAVNKLPAMPLRFASLFEVKGVKTTTVSLDIKKGRIVLVSDPTPGIGKSFTSANFAAVLAAAGQRWHTLPEIALQPAHLLHMVEQTLAKLGGGWRRAALQHRLTDPRLQQLDALGDGRLGQSQHLCRPLKATLLHHGGQRGKQLVVKQISFPYEASA